MSILENWTIVINSSRTDKTNVWKSPDNLKKVHVYRPFISGNVFGHSRFTDGTNINTNFIKEIFSERSDLFVLTVSGSLYKLGKMDPDYEHVYPNTRERILANYQSKPRDRGPDTNIRD